MTLQFQSSVVSDTQESLDLEALHAPISDPDTARLRGGLGLPEPRGRALSASARRRVMRRRGAPIHAFVGPNGSGKTATAVLSLLPTLDGIRWRCENPGHAHTAEGVTEGYRTVLSTVPLLEETTGEPHPLYVPLTEWHQVLHAEHSDLFFDEVTGIAGSREAMGMPVAVQNILQQLRRRDCILIWTAPAWGRADSIIRSCTIAVTVCRGYLPDYRASRGDTPSIWAPKRLFRARTFSAIDFEEYTASMTALKKDGSAKLRPLVVQWWWGPGSRVFNAYNTFDAVSRVGEVLDGGRCAHCGGRRAVPTCKC